MDDASWMINREVKCRCGQMGVITGVEDADGHPEFIWVEHAVRLAMQTHIHRTRQVPALMAQLSH